MRISFFVRSVCTLVGLITIHAQEPGSHYVGVVFSGVKPNGLAKFVDVDVMTQYFDETSWQTMP